ncbi:hypothetical protein B4Q13_15220 [Lacticaseibacillus rhamnosus]
MTGRSARQARRLLALAVMEGGAEVPRPAAAVGKAEQRAHLEGYAPSSNSAKPAGSFSSTAFT